MRVGRWISPLSTSMCLFRLTDSDIYRTIVVDRRWPTLRPLGWRRQRPGRALTRPPAVVPPPPAPPTHLPDAVRAVRRHRSPAVIPVYTNLSRNASFRLCNKLSASSALGESRWIQSWVNRSARDWPMCRGTRDLCILLEGFSENLRMNFGSSKRWPRNLFRVINGATVVPQWICLCGLTFWQASERKWRHSSVIFRRLLANTNINLWQG